MSCIVGGVMSEDASQGSTPEKPIEAPQLAYVKGGTSTQRSENLYEQRYQEAEARRDVAERQRKESEDAQDVAVPGQDAPVKMPGHVGGAVQYSSQMTAHPEVPKAYVLLKYLTPTGSIWIVDGEPVRCRADIIVGADPDHPTELCLMLVCPRCEADSHKHSQDNQLRIFQSNKYWELTPGKGPETFEFREYDERLERWVINIYKSAGVIEESERFSCPDCGWRARIDQNHVRPD
jgi:hypothetical protein